MVKQTYRKLTDRQIIALFRYHRPPHLFQVDRLGIKTKYLAKGIDRLVYRVGKNLVLKIENADMSSLHQTPSEIEALRRVRTDEKFKDIRKNVPKLYYASEEGYTVLVSFHPHKVTDEEFISTADKLAKYFPAAARDFHGNNFRKDLDGTVVCVDLGYSE